MGWGASVMGELTVRPSTPLPLRYYEKTLVPRSGDMWTISICPDKYDIKRPPNMIVCRRFDLLG